MRGLLKTTRLAYYHSVPSIAELLREHISAGYEEGTIVIADEQMDSYLPKGGLWFSFHLFSDLKKNELPLIPLMISTAIAKAIHDMTCLDVRIKWPNHVILDGKKIADTKIEIEHSYDGKKIIMVNIAICTNIDSTENSISIRSALGTEINNNTLLNLFCCRFESMYQRLKEEKDSALDEYRSLLSTINKRVIICTDGAEMTGHAVGIEQDGSLLYRTDAGILKKVDSMDVVFSGIK